MVHGGVLYILWSDGGAPIRCGAQRKLLPFLRRGGPGTSRKSNALTVMPRLQGYRCTGMCVLCSAKAVACLSFPSSLL